MIAVISGSERFHVIEQLNRRGTWELLHIRASTTKDILKDVEQNTQINYIVFDIEALNSNFDAALDVIERLNKTTSTKIIVFSMGFEKGSILERDVLSIGIPPEHVLFVSSDAELKARLIDVLPQQVRPMVASPTVPAAVIEVDAKPTLAQTAAIPSQADRAALKSFQIRKPITKTAKAVTVGVAGAGRRIGTTTQVFQIALFLKALDYSVAIVEMNDHHHLVQLNDTGSPLVSEHYFCIDGFDVYSSTRALLEAKQSFDYAICDYGDYQSIPDLTSYLDKDVKVVCCGVKPWEADLIDNVFATDDGSVNYLFSFVPPSLETTVAEQMSDIIDRTFFAAWCPDIFAYCGKDEMYRKMLAGIITAPDAKAAKTGGFNFFSKKRNGGTL